MLTDEERDILDRGLQLLDSEKLKEFHDGLVRSKTALEDLNSAYPATKEFLEARGLTNVRQLDAAGRADLMNHLQQKLADIFRSSS